MKTNSLVIAGLLLLSNVCHAQEMIDPWGSRTDEPAHPKEEPKPLTMEEICNQPICVNVSENSCPHCDSSQIEFVKNGAAHRAVTWLIIYAERNLKNLKQALATQREISRVAGTSNVYLIHQIATRIVWNKKLRDENIAYLKELKVRPMHMDSKGFEMLANTLNEEMPACVFIFDSIYIPSVYELEE
jgi:hypothetical protein